MDDVVDYGLALVEQNRALADTILSADPGTPVPTCPGWSMLQLLRHVGRGDRWAAHIIRTRAGADLDPRTVPDGRPPDDVDGARRWLHASPVSLLEAVAEVGPDEPVATFAGPRPASWWVRRRLHEATVHRADAALATGQPYQLAPGLASDGIEEWLERLAAELPSSSEVALDESRSISLASTDAGTSWTIRGTATGIQWSPSSSDPPSDVRLSGTAAGLFLALVRRRSVAEANVGIDGDLGIWATWLARTPL